MAALRVHTNKRWYTDYNLHATLKQNYLTYYIIKLQNVKIKSLRVLASKDSVR